MVHFSSNLYATYLYSLAIDDQNIFVIFSTEGVTQFLAVLLDTLHFMPTNRVSCFYNKYIIAKSQKVNKHLSRVELNSNILVTTSKSTWHI